MARRRASGGTSADAATRQDGQLPKAGAPHRVDYVACQMDEQLSVSSERAGAVDWLLVFLRGCNYNAHADADLRQRGARVLVLLFVRPARCLMHRLFDAGTAIPAEGRWSSIKNASARGTRIMAAQMPAEGSSPAVAPAV